MTTDQFLSLFPDHVFQTFDDSKRGRGYLVHCDKPENLVYAPAVLNINGAGIFFSVNRFPEGVRRKEKCVGVNAWFAECDNVSKEKQWENIQRCPLKPSIIVDSKHSLHMYWLTDGRATKENFVQIQMGLATWFGGDESMKDICKVLRVPGFNHMKDPDEPYKVTIIKLAEHLRYSEAQMMAAYPYEKPQLFDERPVYEKKALPATGWTNDTFWDFISELDNRDMLEALSGGALVNGERFSFRPRNGGGFTIWVNDKMCNAWLDKDGMIGSASKGGPTWIQWVKWYGVNDADIARWAKALLRGR